MHSPEKFAVAKRKGWLKECCAHMIKVRATWDLKQCKIDAKRFKHLSDWKQASGKKSGYTIAEQNGWLDECCAHMLPKTLTPPKWTLENCKTDALKYRHRGDWNDARGSGYATAARNGWLDECCAHMTVNVKWTLEACKADAKNHRTRTDWHKSKTYGYAAANRNGWLDECCAHMVRNKLQRLGGAIKWDLKACKADALEYTSRGEWSIESSSAYNSARKNNWLDKCCGHMTDKRKTAHIPTLEECQKEAKKYKYKSYWIEGSRKTYKEASKNGWIELCSGHMKRKKPVPRPK